MALKALECGWVSAAQIESARRTITHHTKRIGRVLPAGFPTNRSPKAAGAAWVQARPISTVMSPSFDPAPVLFELSGVSQETAKEAMRLAGHKLSVLTKFIEKQ